MADKATRKTPVRTAPARKDYPSEVAWLEAKLAHAQEQQAKASESKVRLLDKRIGSAKKQIAALTAKVVKLEEQRTALINGTADWTDEDHLAAEGKV